MVIYLRDKNMGGAVNIIYGNIVNGNIVNGNIVFMGALWWEH